MITVGNKYGVDDDGDAVLLSSRGQQVMMQWEKEYMEKCVEALQISASDDVLEIGFGLAYSATHIQSQRPRSHTIIECDAVVLERANAFASSYRSNGSVVIIEQGAWQSVVPTLGNFDCVFFDDYPLPELESDTQVQRASSRHSRWHGFLGAVVPHLRPGARVTGYMARAIELARDGCHIEITQMPVATSASCDYYPHDSACIPVITVIDPHKATGCRRDAYQNRIECVREHLSLQMIDDVHDTVDVDGADDTSLSPQQDDLTQVTTTQPRPDDSTPTSYQGFSSRASFIADLRQRVRTKQST